MRALTVIVGNPRRASRTTTLAEAVATRVATASEGPSTTQVIELADLAAGLFDWGDDAAKAAERAVLTADAVVVASPVYKATYTGLLKAFLDRIGTGALDGTPCVPVMLGGSPAHSLAVEVHLRPLLTELGGSALPGCYITEAQMAALDDEVDAWWTRARRAMPATAAVTRS